jgi:methylmalonyl-CoA/ethylmalonyl-CoA epimerase
MLRRLCRASVAVNDLDGALRDYGLLGLHAAGDVRYSSRGLGLKWVEMAGADGVCLELIAPTDPGSAVARFLARNGEGLYQLRLDTQSIEASLDAMAARGVSVIRDLPSDGGRKLGWVHPRSTHGVLIELVESGDD